MGPPKEPRKTHLVLPCAYMIIITILIMTLNTSEAIILIVLCLIFRYLVIPNIKIGPLGNHPTQKKVSPVDPELLDAVYKTTLLTRHIRLLRLLPGGSRDAIRCELIEASLEALPEYEAISYVWGPSESQEREAIVCDEHKMYITTSLAQPLHRLRYLDMPRLLWADGLCINQHNLSERGSQVQIMGDIFARASRVIIWLGPDTKDQGVKKAMEVIRYVHSKVHQKIPETGSGRRVVLESSDPTIANLEMHMNRQSVSKSWMALASLFDRPWWRRIWCVQESVLARKAIILCDDHTIDGDLIGTFTRWLYNQRWLGEFTPQWFDETGVKSAYRRLNKWSWQGTFLEIISTFRGLEATDPRDKIYALLGLLQFNPELDVKIVADYRKSLPEVLFDTIKESIHAEGNLHFLSHIHYRPELEHRGDLPSWMPRWDQTREPWQDYLWCETSSISASRSKQLHDFPSLYAPKLHLKGVHVDTIVFVTNILEIRPIYTGSAIAEFIREYLADAQKRIDGLAFEYSSALVILSTTLTGGFLETGGWAEQMAYLERITTSTGHQFLADFVSFINHYFPGQCIDRQRIAEFCDPTLRGRFEAYEKLLIYCSGRRTFRTAQGHIGLGPTCMKRGDVVAVLDGGKVPYVLRPSRVEGEHAFVGECFVRDLMSGQAYDMLQAGRNGVEEREFILR